MAKVVVKIMGRDGVQEKEANTLGELKSSMGLDGYTAAINGTPASDSQSLSDFQVVTFSEAVKGGTR